MFESMGRMDTFIPFLSRQAALNLIAGLASRCTVDCLTWGVSRLTALDLRGNSEVAHGGLAGMSGVLISTHAGVATDMFTTNA